MDEEDIKSLLEVLREINASLVLLAAVQHRAAGLSTEDVADDYNALVEAGFVENERDKKDICRGMVNPYKPKQAAE